MNASTSNHRARDASESGIVLEFASRLAAPQSQVFATLTEADRLTRWFCDRAESEPRAGGSIVLGWTLADVMDRPFTGKWTSFVPVETCAYRGGHAGYPGDDAGLVEFVLQPGFHDVALNEKPLCSTALIVRHTFPDGPDFESFVATYATAWPRALARLEALLALSTLTEHRS